MSVVVSVCIPLYKETPFLKKTVLGVLNQGFKDWELILCINATSAVADTIKHDLAYEIRDPRIRIIVDSTLRNMAENWNAAVEAASGEFVKLLCHDDLLYSDCLERQVKALLENPRAILASGARTIINSDGKRLFKRCGIRRKGLHDGFNMIRRCIMAGANIIGDPVCVMWRRSASNQLGDFDPSVVYCTDMEFWLRLLSIGDLYYDTDPVGFYRIHKGAAAVGLAKVCSEDILHAAKLQEKHSSIKLSSIDCYRIKQVSTFKSILRQYVYRILG
jgi:glycosyltransferase involved in cell wall biosynthesis